jgi:magnesium-transporting ATPase (P-type)
LQNCANDPVLGKSARSGTKEALKKIKTSRMKKYKEILKILLFSIVTAGIVKYIHIFVIWESMENAKNNFQKNIINIDMYQQKTVETFYLELVNLFVLPYVAAIVFYFFSKINLKPKNNFLMFIFLFTILFFLSYFLISSGSILEKTNRNFY